MQREAIVNYHIHSSQRQAFQFDVDGIYGNLVSPELAPTKVNVRDIRGDEKTLNVPRDGVLFGRHSSAITDFSEGSDWQNTYNTELQTLLRDKLGAKEVIVFDHTVRIDDANSPRQPARNVHNDYTAAGAERRMANEIGEERARELAAGHYSFINVWRPVLPIHSSPLGFIKPESITAEDYMTIDLVYPNDLREILGVAANSKHEWFYCSAMTPDEVIIFNTYDNHGQPHIAHSALDMKSTSNLHTPRQSIESRTIVRY